MTNDYDDNYSTCRETSAAFWAIDEDEDDAVEMDEP